MEEYLVVNGIGNIVVEETAAKRAEADRKKVSVLITLVGSQVYGTLRDLCSPAMPIEKSFTELCTLLRDYYRPKTIQVAETFKFNQCKQTESESVSVFSAQLRRLASSCDFGEDLQRRVRDQLVSGICSAETQKKLFQKD